MVLIDDWIKFWCRHSDADLVISLRAQLHQILATKIQNPRKKDFTRGESAILDAIVALIASRSSAVHQKYSGVGVEDDFSGGGGGGGGNEDWFSLPEYRADGEEVEDEQEDFDHDDYVN